MGSKILSEFQDDICIVLCGEAGQGLQTVENLLTRTLKLAGYHIFSTKRVSSKKVSAPVDRADILIPLSEGAVEHVSNRISPETLLLGEKELFGDEYEGDRAIDVPLSKIASEVGGRIYSNTIAVGTLLGLFGVDPNILYDYLEKQFGSKGEDVLQKNVEATKKG